MKLKKVLSICKTNGLYYLYDRIDRSGEITQWLGDACALYPLDGLPILDEESFCAVFDITGKQREKILFRHERLPEHLNVEDVAAGDKLVREYETTFINGGLRLKPLKTNNGVMFIRSLYLSPLEDVIDMVQFYERTTPQGGSYIVAKAGFLTAAVIMPYVISKKFADELEELSYQCRHFLNTRSAFTTPAAEDEEEPDENQTAEYDPNANLWHNLLDALKAEQEECATRQARKIRPCPVCGEPLEVTSITDNRHSPGGFDVIARCQNCRSNYKWFCDKDGGVTDMKEHFFG